MKAIVLSIESNRTAYVESKYGKLLMTKKPTDIISIGDEVLASNIQGLENHDEYVTLKKVL